MDRVKQICTVCGCGSERADSDRKQHGRRIHSHDHSHGPLHDPAHHHHHFGSNAYGASVAGFEDSTLIQIEADILSKNDRYAAANRARFADRRVLALNLLSSPGAGKTTLLVETAKALKDALPLGIIEGDQETANDADRIRATGVEAVQINTGRGCHLDAHMVGHALDDLNDLSNGVIFIENVGNLVCPAAFDLGEAAKVVLLSVTEGDDKPLKYPDMFAAADLVVFTKIDLLPHVDFDLRMAFVRALRINPNLHHLTVSARTGAGMDQWFDWIKNKKLAVVNGSSFATIAKVSTQHP